MKNTPKLQQGRHHQTINSTCFTNKRQPQIEINASKSGVWVPEAIRSSILWYHKYLRSYEDFKDGGYDVVSDADKVNIESSMKSQSNTLIEYHISLSSLMEFCYDLGIAPSYNVSGGFGFESFIGIMKWNGSQYIIEMKENIVELNAEHDTFTKHTENKHIYLTPKC